LLALSKLIPTLIEPVIARTALYFKGTIRPFIALGEFEIFPAPPANLGNKLYR
jgi:hypothetical protein